ncbi:MAG: hypothetical protein K0S35_3775 [Geminicoccaceae bacterium]|nr:hypothetical protein [Geminicoccaceae bacterium]
MRATSIRTSSPPWRACEARSACSPSSVTTLATRRPPGARACQQTSSRPGRLAPPPTKIASGAGNPSRQSGAAPCRSSSSGVSAISAQRPASRSIATARPRRIARSHSIATAPLPAPTSQRHWPGSGMSRASVAARTSRLVSMPSERNASSGSPGTLAWIVVPGPASQAIASVLSAARLAGRQHAALASMRRSAAPPRCSKAKSRLGPKPRVQSSAAIWFGVSPSWLSTTRRAPGTRWRCSAPRGRPCRLIASTSALDQPRRAQTRLITDGAGRTRISSGPKRRASSSPTPKHIGSPLARTTTRLPRRAARSSSVASSGLRQQMRSPG